MKHKVAVVFICMLISACSGTGGAIGGLIPAPKLLKGNVSGDIYYAQDGSFQVNLPHPPSVSSSEWRYTKVTEGTTDTFTKVIFGPAAFDINFYHVTFIKQSEINGFSSHSDQLFNDVTKMQVYREVHEPKQLVKKSIVINGNKGFYSAHQMGPSQWLLAAVVYFDDSYYVVEADISRSVKGPFNPSEEEVINMEYQVFNRLLEGFKVSPQ
ncbi:hypothetical protein [Pelagibaculum spongiae]|uniref:Gliding motility lipoprotein GldD n=1 Tax=Pelagibaculum spongiae TaxID=2080658 RepID=A0A2V1GYJ7_9GAMM|nr:hypothetical protein [Pelagibaculum spongiae]PVZ71846.1 hypothetical protein DC094_02130 [Pelagibaculum spongiae]